MLTRNQHLLFLETKIHEVKRAIFKADINAELQLPNNIISILKTDSKGNVWFFTSCNRGYANKIDKHFFAYLDFFQKGQQFRLRLSGNASIVEGDEEESSVADAPSKGDIVLIKFKILYAAYLENKPSLNLSITNKVKIFFSTFFIPAGGRRYDFSKYFF